MSHKRFFIGTVCLTVFVIGILAGATAIIDPFFHYHAPLSGIGYTIDNQRYQNDGILKNFDYQAIITGSSVTENFNASEFDALFNTKSIKVPFSGSYLKETSDRLQTAFLYNDEIDYVLRSLDFYAVISDKDYISDFDYPTYLYDGNIANDTQYLLNKSVLFSQTLKTIKNTVLGFKTPSFDDCYNWSDNYQYGKAYVTERYDRDSIEKENSEFTKKLRQTIRENLQQNIINLALEHPDTEFYIFFPPYNILTWDSWSQSGKLSRNIDIMEFTAELLTEYDNIRLFSFNDCFDTICDFDNYKDPEHYGEWINSDILKCMSRDDGLLTKENYTEHFDKLRSFYTTYDYDSVFE